MQSDRCRSVENGFSWSDVKVIGSIEKTRQTGSYTPFRRWWQPDERTPATICTIEWLIEMKKRFDYYFQKCLSNFCPLSPLFPLPPFCPPLSPTTPITPYNPPNIFRAPPFPPRVFSASAGVICASARVDGAGCAKIVQKWINNSYTKLQTGSFPLQPSISKSYTVSQQSRP